MTIRFCAEHYHFIVILILFIYLLGSRIEMEEADTASRAPSSVNEIKPQILNGSEENCMNERIVFS